MYIFYLAPGNPIYIYVQIEFHRDQSLPSTAGGSFVTPQPPAVSIAVRLVISSQMHIIRYNACCYDT